MESKITLCLFIFGISQASASVLPKWSDIFSSLKPYQDEETLMLQEEDGDPRVGFVQVYAARVKVCLSKGKMFFGKLLLGKKVMLQNYEYAPTIGIIFISFGLIKNNKP